MDRHGFAGDVHIGRSHGTSGWRSCRAIRNRREPLTSERENLGVTNSSAGPTTVTTSVKDPDSRGAAGAGTSLVGMKRRTNEATVVEQTFHPMVMAAIPALNEGPTIGSVVLKVRQFADQVIVIDDGSTDDTAEVASLAGAHVIRHARNLGKGMAVRSAWLYAREKDLECLVLLDGDHQHDPNDIPRLLEPVLSRKADVVIGVRWGKTSGMPMYRRVGKRALDFATAAALRNGMVTDSQSGYRVFSRRALLSLEPSENGLSIESQMLLEAQEKNLRITEVHIDARYDLDGSTISPGKHGTSVLGRIIVLVSEKRPLFFFGVFGALLLLIASGLGVVVLQTYRTTGLLATGYTFIVVLFGIVGILSIFMGITLNALKRISAK